MDTYLSGRSVTASRSLNSMTRKRAYTCELSALSRPTEGTCIWVGDWPHKVKTVQCICPGRYKVTLVRLK